MRKNTVFLRPAPFSSGKLLLSCLCFTACINVASAQEPASLNEAGIATEPATQPFQLAAPTYNSSSDLQYHVPSDKLDLMSININDKEIQLPVIRFSARQAMVKGVTILIGDIHAQGHIDPSLHALAAALPDWGWHTILVSPSHEYFAHAARSNNDDQTSTEADAASVQENAASNTASNTPQSNSTSAPNFPQVDISPSALQAPELDYTQDEYVQFLAALGQAIDKQFAQQAGYKIVYAKGKSAAGFAQLYSAAPPSGINAVVFDNIYWPAPQYNGAVAKHVSSLTIPVLDLVNNVDNHWAQQSAAPRAIAAKINLRPMYRQREISSVGFNQHQYVAKEVISWTSYLGW